MDRTALVSLGNQVVVIGLDGKLRVLTEGQQPRPGEVVVTSTDVGPLDLNVQLTQEQGSKDVTDDVLQIISAIEQGQDPSAVDEEFAPAAGENGGSSLQTSATIVRDGTELLASTSFETIGIESLGLSQTQVLALNDLFRSNLQTSADSTDKPLATTPVTLDAIEEDGGSIIITTEELLSNVDDEDKDTLSVENLIIDKGNGTLVDNGDGTWTFTPQIDDDTEVSFTFDIIDDEDIVVSGSANLDILPINDAPNAENDVITTEEDTAVTIDVLVNDSDVEGDALSIQSASVPKEQGTVEVVDGKLVFTPAENFNGEATISYIVTDGDLTDEAKVSVTVTPVNDSPVAVDDTTSIQEDTAVTIDVLTNDTDVDGDKLSIESASVPKEQGTVEVVDGKLVFTPAENFNGDAEITYTVTDGELTDEAKVTVTVNPVNDVPTIKVEAVESITEDAVSTDTVLATLTVRDTDTPEDQLTVSLENNSNGYFVLVGNEVKLSQAGVDAVNNDELNLKDLTISASVSDGVNPTASDSDSLIVNRVNDAPTIKIDAVESITEDAVSTDTVLATLTVRDTDTPEDQLTVSLENNSNGYFVLVGNEVKLTQAGVDAVNNDELNLKDLTISASVSDGVNPTAGDSDSLVVNRVNDAPTVENAIADQVLSEDFDAYTIDLNEVFKDSDSSLEFSVSGNNSIQISIVNGVATINPTADWNGKETITFTAKDPSGESVSQTVDFTVAPVVDIKADSTNVVEDTPTIINVLGNDTFDGDDKVVSLDTNNGPANGTVSVNPDGSVTYTPNDNYHGADSFTYIVTSGGVSESTTVNVDVTPVNDAPVATNDTAITDEDTPVTIDVLPNDTDVDGDKLSIESASVPKEQGTVEVVNGKLVFTPAENFNGDAEITYTVTDGQLTDEAKVTVTVNPVNDAPTIKVDAVESITEDAVSIDTVVAALTVRDTDTPEDQLAVSLENNSNGYFVLVGNEVKLTQAGVDAVNNDELNLKDLTISASVSDGVNPTASDSDSLVVNRVNDAPTVENAIADQVLSEDFDAYTIDLNEVFKDSDSSLEFSVSGNNSIQISIVSGVATITPTADWNGKETITFTAKDPSGESVSQTVNFTVAPVVDIEADSANVVEDTPTIISVLGNDTFESTDKVVSLDAENGPKNGTVIVNNDGTVTYTPDDNYVGEDTFTYIVTSGGVSESAIVEVNVTPVNNAPLAKEDIATTQEDTAVTIDVLSNDSDVDGDKLSIQSASVPEAQGKVEVVDGKLVFTPAENFNGHAEITYTVTDGQLTDEAKVTVTVNPVNDAPTIKVDAVESITEDAVSIDTVVAALTVRDTDTPEDQLAVSLENNSNGYFVLVGNEVKLTQAGVDAVNNDELNLKDLTISASVSDGVNPTANDSDSLVVNRVNDAPTVENAIADQVLSEDFDAYTIDLNEVFKDSDSSLEFSVSGNSNVLVSIENGIATISPTADWNGSETLIFTATEPSGESVSQTVNFTVAPVADIVADKATVVEDTSTIIKVLGNDTFEGTDKVVSLDTNNGPANGTVSVNPDGSVTYTPNDNYHGADSFTYIVTSGGVSESTTVSVDVTPENDAPVAKDDTAITDEDTPVTIDVLPNDSDVDGDKLSIESASVPKEQGTVEVVNGKLVFTPAENFNGDAEITYTVTDGQLTDEAKVTVTVNPVNDAPTIKVDAVESITEDAVSTDTVVATLTVRDTDTPEDQLTVSLENNSNGYFVLVGNEVKLTQAGVDAVNNDELNLKDLTISASVSDGVNPTASDSDSLIVNRVNDAPTVENAIADQELSEDFATYTIDLNDAFKDSDSALNFSVSGNSNVLVSIENGIATISPTADWNGSETLTFTATDPSGESISQTVNFTVAPVADIVADKATVVEDTPTIIKVLGNDTFEGDGKVVSLDTNNGPANGTVSVNPDGSVTYTPNDNYHGTDSFTYIVTSGGVSESTTVNVDVTPVNDAPVAKDDIATTQEDTAVTIDALPNDTDADGDKLSIESASVPKEQGTVEVVDGKLVFTPAENFNGDAEITYNVTDGQLTDEAKVTVTVNPVNDAPTIKVDAVESITEDAVNTDTVVATLTVRDTDTPEDQLTVSLENNSNGYFVLVGNEVKLTKAGVDAVNNDELNLKDLTISASVSDGVNPTANDSDSLIVNRVNDAPTIKVDAVESITEDAVNTDTVVATLTVRDTDTPEDQLTVSLENNSNGYFVLVGNEVKLTKAGVDAVNNDELNLKDLTISASVSDGVNPTANDSDSLIVNRVNDAPTIKVDAVESITENAVSTDTVVATLTVRDTDTPEDRLTVSLENNSNGYFVLVGDEVKLTQAGVDAVNNDELDLKDLTISASVSDGVNPTASDSDSLVVNRVNDAPTVENAIADQVLSEDFDAYTIDLNEVFKDSDSSLEFSVSGNNSIQISIVSGVATITPTADWNGKETITFTAKDPSGESVSQTVNFTVAPVVDIEADSTNVVEDTPTIINVLGNDTFEGKDKVVSLDAENGPKNGTVIVNNDGTVTYTPNDNYVGKDTFTYIVTSGGVSESTTVEVNVTPVNDAPVAKDDIATTQEDTAVTIDVLPNDTDVDGDKLSIQSATVPEAQGKVEIVDGKLVFTPAENFNGQAEITYTVTDGQLTDEAKVTVTVNPVNDAPTIKVDAVESITEDAVSTDTVVATLTVRDTDTPEDQLTVSLKNNSNGYFVLVGDEVKLTQAGVDAVNNDELNLKDLTISASVSDGVNPTASDSDSLIVNRVNDAPTVENAIADQVLSEDFASYTIDLNDAFKDSDSALNFSVSGNSNVLVSIENGIATISPTADWNGSETLTFTATDPSGESVSQTVDFTVAPVVDIEADSTNVVEDTPTIINVLGNDTFEGKDKVVSLDAENGPKNGTVIVNNDGTVTYTPDDNYVGKDTFTYVVTSGGVSESTTVTFNVTPVNDKPESEDFTHVADDQLTQVVFDTDTKPLGSGDSKDHIADVEDDLKGNDLYVRITELPTSGTLFFKDSDGELHEIKEVSDTLYDKDSLYYEADNVGFLLGIKDRPNTPNGSESTSDFNNWGLSEDGGPSHSRTEHLANGASITISSDSGELAQYNRQVSHIGNGIADNDGQGIEKGETITIDLSNNPVGSVNLGLDGLGGLFDYGDDNAALITVTYLDSNNVQQTQTFEFLKPEGNFMLFQETSVGYGKDLALPEGSVITQLDFSTKNEGNWELRYVEGVPAEDSFGYVAVDSESGVSDPSTVNIVNEMLDGNVAENGPAVQSITGVTVVEGDDVTFSVSLNNATDQTVKYQVDFSAEGSSTSSQDIDLSNATFTNGVKYLGGYLIVPAGVNGFEITIPSIDDQLVESTESLVIKVGDVSGVGYIDDNDVPPTVQSNEISGLEDEAIVITLEHLGIVDSGVSVEFDTSALNGSLQVKGSDGWEVVSSSVLASDIENGLVRYVPAEHESGADVFDKDGVGNGLDTYEQIHFTVSDGNSSASGTLSIDIEPVADPIKIDLTFGPVTSVPVTLGGSWSTDEELKDLLEASNLPGLDFEHVVTQAFNNGHAGNDLMLSGDTESPLSFVGDQQAGANVDAQGSDIFVTGGGNDSIYGGIGSLDDQAETDTVVYSGKLSDYDFSYYPASDHSEVPYWIVEDSRFIDTKDVVSSTHKESGDHLYEIEQLIFQDAIIKLDNNTGEYVVLTEQQVSFELNLDLIDVDGSESFINDSVTLTGIPSGLTLEVNGKTVTENSDGSYTVDLSSEPNQTSHQLSGTITVPADYNGSLDFDVTATAGSVEVNNNTQMGADTASVSVRDYEFVSGTHGDNNIVGSDDNDVIVGDVQGLQIVEGQDYNIAFMLDTSGSMGYDVGRAVTELKTVLNTLIESASGPHSGKVNVLLTTFSTESKQVLELDLSSDNAKSQVESILDAIVKLGDGNTNYEAGFQSALNWFENADSGATNLSYFISDGRPNQATDNNVNWYSSKESVVLGVSEQQLVTLADVLPSDYRFGDTVTYNNKTVIDFRGTVYSLSTGEEMGRMLNSYEYDDFGNNVLEQANNAYSALAEFSEVRSIGIGGHLNEDSLKHFDSDGVVRTNIDVNQLAEVILGKEVSLMQGKDEISSLDGNDIIFGDAIRFDINGEQGVSALQNYVASQLGKDVALVTKEEVHHYITENQAEFEQSRYYDQADTIYGGAGNDILFGQGGNDKLFGGADNDILIGGLGSDILTGGDGEDIFKWIDVANERDTVTDFSSSEDSLDFSDLFDDLSKDEVGDLLSDLQSGSHTGDAGGYHVEVSQDGSADTNLSITKGSSTLDIHFNSASVDDITQHLIASLDSQYKDM
ncbi:tandem-95 repeat protein [Vibrio parahaemolyticus]|nr:tandem-95 repeat protein [Vibrio parahaemolyticus]